MPLRSAKPSPALNALLNRVQVGGKQIGEAFRSPVIVAAAGALLIVLGMAFWGKGRFSLMPQYGAEEIAEKKDGARTPYVPPRPDAAEALEAFPDTFATDLTTQAARTRRLDTLTLLTPQHISPSDVMEILGIYPSELPSFWAGGAQLYLWTQKEGARIVAIVSYYEPEVPRYEKLFERTLLENASTILMEDRFGPQTKTTFERTAYKGVTIHYLNFPMPDLALDYAFLPEQRAFIFAASREAMQATIDRLTE